MQAFDARPALAAYRGPTKVVFGLDDRIVPARHARGLPGRIGVHLFANVGHMPHFEARAEVAEMIQDNIAAGENRWEPAPIVGDDGDCGCKIPAAQFFEAWPNRAMGQSPQYRSNFWFPSATVAWRGCVKRRFAGRFDWRA